jgi:predicted ATP-grasp superfamily ATP-dependent carboligase
MRHFLIEFITGGGLSGKDLPRALVKEGEMMIQTIFNDLIEAEYSDIALTRDKRLKSFEHKSKQYIIRESLEEELNEYICKSDIVWLIAPETNDCLATFTEKFAKNKQIYIGSTPNAIRISADKLLTNKLLAEAGIKTVDTKSLDNEIIESETGWIIKPNDGVGGQSCYFINDKEKLARVIVENKNEDFIIQPFVDGRHMSMSLLVFDGAVRLLACNEQYIDIRNGCVSLIGIGVNECLHLKDEMKCLALKIISTISGFSGYIGVDMIEFNGDIFVLEINPRFTTAYVGLSRSLGYNITKKILDTFLKKKLPDIDLMAAVPIRINI